MEFKQIEANQASPYIRVGDNYYKRITRVDIYDREFSDLEQIARQTIIDDHSKGFLAEIDKFDAFCNVPNHFNYQPKRGNCYNVYRPFIHTPAKGDWTWSERLMKHVFGDQYELGMDYMQMLYQNPTQILPILCLVSKENATGKTTFLNWLNTIFAGNVAIVGNQDIHGQFNSHYAYKLIVAVDESRIDKQATLEKLKSMATSKVINVNVKFVKQYTLGFFGKIILCSNFEDSFINAGSDDIRYWIRKLSRPEFFNVNIEHDLEQEIPAFLHHLSHRQLSTEHQSRMWFHPDLLETQALAAVRDHSHSWMYKELFEVLEDYFLRNSTVTRFYATPKDIKDRFFHNNSRVEIGYIRRVLKLEFNKSADGVLSYVPFSEGGMAVAGRAYLFTREEFGLNGEPIDEDKLPF